MIAYLGLGSLLLTTAIVIHMGAFMLMAGYRASQMQMPIIASALYGAAWFCLAHILEAIPYTIQVVATGSWMQGFDTTYYGSLLAYMLAGLRMLEPARHKFWLEPSSYYPIVASVYSAWVYVWLLFLEVI